MTIGEQLKKIRKENGYTVKDVVTEANLGGTSRKADIARLERIEEGKDQPTFDQLKELKNVLGFDIGDLLQGNLSDQVKSWATFNNNCRKLYLESNYSLKELHELMGIEYYYVVSRLFSNSAVKTNISDEDIQKIMDFFQVDMDYLNTERDINYFDKKAAKTTDTKKSNCNPKLELEIQKLKTKVEEQQEQIQILNDKVNNKKSFLQRLLTG